MQWKTEYVVVVCRVSVRGEAKKEVLSAKVDEKVTGVHRLMETRMRRD